MWCAQVAGAGPLCVCVYELKTLCAVEQPQCDIRKCGCTENVNVHITC